MRKLMTILLLILMLPTASATTLIDVNTQGLNQFPLTSPVFSDVYSFQLSGTVFLNPIYRAFVVEDYDFGEVHAGQTVRVETASNISNVRVQMNGYGTKNWIGESNGHISVIVNDTLAWDQSICKRTLAQCGILGTKFRYRDSQMIFYAENQTAYVPSDPLNGHPRFDFNGCSNTCPHLVTGLTGLFWVPEDSVGELTNPINSTTTTFILNLSTGARIYWLANETHPSFWNVETRYIDRLPDKFTLEYQFTDQTSFFNQADAFAASGKSCGGLASVVKSVIGVCPTITGVVEWSIEFIPNLLATIIGFVSPRAGEFIRLSGRIAGQFAAMYVFMLVLLLTNVGKVFVWLAVSVSFFSLLAGGVKGDMSVVAQGHITGFKVLGYAIFGYFWIYYMIGKFIILMAVRIFQAIGSYVGGIL